MGFDLKVSLENIIPLTYARDHFSTIVNEVQSDKMYILTKGGKPAIALIDVKYLEQLTGGEIKKAQIKEEINKNPEQVGLPKMVGHPSTSSGQVPVPIPTPIPPKPTFGSLKFKPTPPPPLATPSAPSPKPAAPYPPKPTVFSQRPPMSNIPVTPPLSTPKPAQPIQPPKPPTPISPSTTPPPVSSAPKTPPAAPPTPPPNPPTPGSLIVPEDEIEKPASSAPQVNDNAKIEVEFSTENADLEPSKPAPSTFSSQFENGYQNKPATPTPNKDEPEEMEIG